MKPATMVDLQSEKPLRHSSSSLQSSSKSLPGYPVQTQPRRKITSITALSNNQTSYQLSQVSWGSPFHLTTWVSLFPSFSPFGHTVSCPVQHHQHRLSKMLYSKTETPAPREQCPPDDEHRQCHIRRYILQRAIRSSGMFRAGNSPR